MAPLLHYSLQTQVRYELVFSNGFHYRWRQNGLRMSMISLEHFHIWVYISFSTFHPFESSTPVHLIYFDPYAKTKRGPPSCLTSTLYTIHHHCIPLAVCQNHRFSISYFTNHKHTEVSTHAHCTNELKLHWKGFRNMFAQFVSFALECILYKNSGTK